MCRNKTASLKGFLFLIVLYIIQYFFLNTGAQSETVSETSNNENRPSGKSKKRATWKAGKTDFSHPWLLKNLKGHPGNVLLMDFSANGKFLAATCDG